MPKRVAILTAAFAVLCAPAGARANGDPASDYLLAQSLFLPFNAKIDPTAEKRLSNVVSEAEKAGFRIRVAIIRTAYDLGTAFSLMNKPQRYAKFLSLELSFVYRDRLLVVMPKGFGYAVNGKLDPKASGVLKLLPAPGPDATKEVEGAAVAVQRLAAAAGYTIVVKTGGDTGTRDRITIAAAATAGIALFAGIVLYRRQRRTL